MDAVIERPVRAYAVYVDEPGQRVPVKSWASVVEPGAVEQALNLARLPFAIGHVALMPDAHVGYGMPIGGVLFADKAVVPYAVGVDIGCGVTLIETEATVESLGGALERRATVKRLLDQVARDVPVGNGPQGGHRLPEGEPFSDFDESGVTAVALSAIREAEPQLGTMGGGNHFAELQQDPSTGRLYFMIHSGSRSVGKKICDHHHEIANSMNSLWRSDRPHVELSWLPWDSAEAKAYWRDMEVALRWAEESRRRMAGKAIAAIGRVLGAAAWQAVDVHHNYAAWENHLGRNGIVHRKGAVRARLGETVLIPGSMGTASYVARGLGSRDSFQTCQHGAGRLMSRGAARRAMAGVKIDEDLGDVVLVTPGGDVLDEAPRAYKDVDDVMDASRDLVASVTRLTPLGVLKGGDDPRSRRRGGRKVVKDA